jgi:putative Mn2+ efflux pump MntP
LPYKRSFTTAGISASISAMTVSADIANLKLVLQNHVISLGTRSNDLLAASYTKTFGFLKATPTLLQELI